MTRPSITVGDIRRAIEGVPDDVTVLFNVEEDNNDNWDTYDVSFSNTSYLCMGESGCTHTEPEMLWDIVVFVRAPSLEDRSITNTRNLDE
jgi:hypothetical protein